MRAEVFDSFCFLLIGMLVGEAMRVKGFLSSEHPLQANEALELEAWLKSRDPDSPILFPSRPTDQPLNARCLNESLRGGSSDPEGQTTLSCAEALNCYAPTGRGHGAAFCAGLARALEHTEAAAPLKTVL